MGAGGGRAMVLDQFSRASGTCERAKDSLDAVLALESLAADFRG